MPLQQTSGAASYDAFGGGAPVAAKYIEDFFQTWLRTGTGSSTTVTTGLNASINKSLVWTKSRSAATNHKLTDTARGVTKALSSNTTGAEVTDSQGLTAFSSTGYTIGTNTDYNNSGATYVDWQWVATPKFFDVVTWTGNSTANRAIPHSLGATPGTIIVKKLDSAVGNFGWPVWHRSLAADGANRFLFLNTTDPVDGGGAFNAQLPTATEFYVGNNILTNYAGSQYVAYLFAHNAGGFGLTGTDNVISCGSYSGSGAAGNAINLGYEPQWVMIKNATNVTSWQMFDVMRGMPVPASGNTTRRLQANTSSAEFGLDPVGCFPTATGFTLNTANGDFNASGDNYIYIAIRRGPMKVPTDGTSVFAPVASNASTGTTLTTNFPVDLQMAALRPGNASNTTFSTRLTGINSQNTAVLTPYLVSSSTAAETTGSVTRYWINDSFQMPGAFAGTDTIFWNFRRAPGFFDVVCWTNTGATQSINHNLGVAPELIITKRRPNAENWQIYSATTGASAYLTFTTAAVVTGNTNRWNATSPTASVFTTGTAFQTSETYVAYLFASCPGVSKVTNFTGTGALQTINCGFTGGARFVLIKRTDSTGNWFVWDSSRGLSSSNDPYLMLNSTAAEVTSTNWVDTTATGFQVTAASGNDVNINGASYIALAIA